MVDPEPLVYPYWKCKKTTKTGLSDDEINGRVMVVAVCLPCP